MKFNDWVKSLDDQFVDVVTYTMPQGLEDGRLITFHGKVKCYEDFLLLFPLLNEEVEKDAIAIRYKDIETIGTNQGISGQAHVNEWFKSLQEDLENGDLGTGV